LPSKFPQKGRGIAPPPFLHGYFQPQKVFITEGARRHSTFMLCLPGMRLLKFGRITPVRIGIFGGVTDLSAALIPVENAYGFF
jgi:hypothetical protein